MYRVSVRWVTGDALADADHTGHSVDGEVGWSGVITDDVVRHGVVRSLWRNKVDSWVSVGIGRIRIKALEQLGSFS